MEQYRRATYFEKIAVTEENGAAMKEELGKSFVGLFALFCCFTLLQSPAVGDQAQERIRPPMVAGQFYPGNPDELRETAVRLINQAAPRVPPGKVRALIVPHAGYIYSGQVAASGYKSLDRRYKKFLILASNHSADALPFTFSVPDADFFQTPLGKVRVSPAIRELKKNALFTTVPEADAGHVIEVQLPFLQTLYADFEILPVITGAVTRRELLAAAEVLQKLMDEDTAIIVSSDLSHYFSYDRALQLDRSCIRAVAANDLEKAAQCEACGLPAIIILLQTAKEKGWTGEVLDYKNSGDVTGSKGNVVGYSAIAFYKPDELQKQETIEGKDVPLSKEEQTKLLQLSRDTLLSWTAQHKKPNPDPLLFSNYANEDRACFVTLEKHGELRGCIGSLTSRGSLVDCIVDNTVNAASEDPRFPSVAPDETAQIRIEISVLEPAVKYEKSDHLQLLNDLVPDRDGVILRRNGYQSTYLPQVWKQLPDKAEFLGHLCEKGGMKEDCWKDAGTEVWIYKAFPFKEAE